MSEKQCDLPVMFRYTWPGGNEHYACFAHAARAVRLAEVMGFRLQVIRLEIDETLENHCDHTLKGTEKDGEE